MQGRHLFDFVRDKRSVLKPTLRIAPPLERNREIMRPSRAMQERHVLSDPGKGTLYAGTRNAT